MRIAIYAMAEPNFPDIIQQYFEQRNTFPVAMLFKNSQVDDKFLLKLKETVQTHFSSQDKITLHNTKIVSGQFWSGVLLEFNQSEFDDVETTEIDWSTESNTLYSHLADIYKEFATYDTLITGLHFGSEVYPVSAVHSLGKNYFTQ